MEKQFQVLEELIRTAYNIINGEEDLSYLTQKDLRDRLYGENPACFLKLQPIGRDTSTYILPLCNRHGIEDPRVIKISIKVVQNLIGSGKFDVNILNTLLSKLQHRHDVFVKRVPKPPIAAAKKANVTKNMNSIVNMIKGNLVKTDEI
jgi:hypothetical protein